MSREAPELISRLPSNAGSCSTCRYAELRSTARSFFVRCRRSEDDPKFAKYPRLPVIDCPGYEPLPRSDDSEGVEV